MCLGNEQLGGPQHGWVRNAVRADVVFPETRTGHLGLFLKVSKLLQTFFENKQTNKRLRQGLSSPDWP